MSGPLLEADGLGKSYGGVAAVSDLSLRLGPGELLAMIGPNGAGKSTSFDMLSGQVAPDRGRISIRGRDTAGLGPAAIGRLGVGRTFQVASVFGSMTVRENVQTAILARRGRLVPWGRSAGRRERGPADALLALVGMEREADRACGELAYGDLKRVELATALAGEPALLLMDEPTAGMAAAERAALMALVARIAREQGVGVLFTEHDMDVVFGHADRVLVLDRGRVIAAGDPDAVRRDPQVRAVYLGTARTFDGAPAAAGHPP